MAVNERAAKVEYVEVGPERAGQRLDNFLMQRLRNVPRSLVYRIVRKGEVRVNRGRVKPDYRLCSGDTVRVPPVRVSAPSPAADGALAKVLATRIVHEDDSLLVLNKPAGAAVHGGTGISAGVIETLRSMRPQWRDLELVHRLDRATSGCLLLARHRQALTHFNALLRRREVDKRYLALVARQWPHDMREVDAPLAREQAGPGQARDMGVDEAGREALTRFELLQSLPGASLVEVTIVTGRMHQIRVHAAHAGHPVAGDDRYGEPGFNRRLKALGLRRMFLHAHRITLADPAGESMTFEAPLDDDLRGVLDALESGE